MLDPLHDSAHDGVCVWFSLCETDILRHLCAGEHKMRKITSADYDALREIFYGEAIRNQKQPGSNKKSGGNYYSTKLSYLGQRYTGDVFKQYFSGQIDSVRASEMLHSKVDHLPRLEAAFFRGVV